MSQGDNCKVSNCVFAGEIYFENTAGVQGKGGAMVAYINSGSLTVTNCLNLGKIHTKNAGGIVGGGDVTTTITNCFNLSDELSGVYVADIVSWNSTPGLMLNTSLIEGYGVGKVNGNDPSQGQGVMYNGVVNTITMEQFLTANLSGWYYADGYLPSPIEGLQLAIPQA